MWRIRLDDGHIQFELSRTNPQDGRIANVEKRRQFEFAPSQPCLESNIRPYTGRITLAQGKREQGLDLLQKAASAAPDHPDIAYHAISALHETGAIAKAREQLTGLLEKHSEFPSRKDAEALLARIGD